MAIADVTIRGGGIFGLSVAWACLLRGARVRVIEARQIGAGASGGIVGALAPHVPEKWTPKKAFQLESLLMAEEWWAGIAALSGQDPGYARTGRLQPLLDDAAIALAETRGRSAQQLWQGRADWRVAPAADFPEWAPSSPTGLVVHDTLTARVHPRQAVLALASAIRAKGGQVIEGEEAADQGAVVHATGWQGLATLTDSFGTPMGSGEKGQALLVAHFAPPLPQLFADALHIVPHADGTTAIGSTSERIFDTPDATDAKLDALHAKAIEICPTLGNAPILQRWAGLRPRAKTRAPMLGGWPERPGHYIANGGFKIGFGIAPMVGQVMADLVLEGRDAIPEGFRPEDSF